MANITYIFNENTRSNYKEGKIIASNDRGLLATLSLYLPNYKIRSLNTTGVYNHWDLKYPLSEMEKKDRLLFVLLINNQKDTLKKTMKELREQFTTVEIATAKNTGDLIIQGKKTISNIKRKIL